VADTLAGMPRLKLLPETLTLAPFSVQDARRLGVTKGRLRSRDLSIPFRGVRCDPAMQRDFETRCDAYATKMGPGAFFSHTTAAALFGMPLPWLEPMPRLHVSVLEPAKAPRGERIAGHQLARDSVTGRILRGKPVLEIVDVWCQLAGEIALDHLVAAGDSLLGGRHPLVSLDELRLEVEERAGRRGAARLRNALSLMRVGAESPKETELRLLLHRAGFPEPELNIDILSRRGVFIARGDIVYRWCKLLVEYDGSQHATDRGQYVRDVERGENLERAGWRTVRVLKEHMRAPDDVVARVAKVLRARGWRP
jgi:hypothetical protein